MHTSCSFSSILVSFLYVLFVQTVFLPTPAFFGKKTLSVLPIANDSGTTHAAGVTPISVSYRDIYLAFTAKGRPIPEDEVRETLIEADQAIHELVRDHPTQRITHDRFDYRRQNGDMLISIATKEDEMITWMELRRILQALYHYMTGGPGAQTTHYQTLEFEIEAAGQVKPTIGLGVVWYFKPAGSGVQKRTALPLSISSLREEDLQNLNLSYPQLLSTSLALPASMVEQETTTFPIPRTSLSLKFYFFGQPIPSQSVQAMLRGAMAKVRPFLNGESEMQRIEDDAFRWILPVSREVSTPVVVTVYTYYGHEITWRQLFDVLFGLFAFTTTFGTDLQETHYQILGFKILDQISLKVLGVGGIGYFRSRTDELAKRDEAIDKGMALRRPNALNVSLLNLVMSRPIVYPVANTDIVLTFTFLGKVIIPPREIQGALRHARQGIAASVEHEPHTSIPGGFRDVFGDVTLNVLVYVGRLMEWTELDNVLSGLSQFCQDDRSHDRVLVFEIDIHDRGRVGFGTLLYAEPDPANLGRGRLTARDTTLQIPNSTVISQPDSTTQTVPTAYPVPGTRITISFNTFGPLIPPIYVNAAFTSALRKIGNHVHYHPDDPIPNGRWEHRGYVTKVWIEIVAFDDGVITWQELSSVLKAILRFMTDARDVFCHDMMFFMERVGEVAKGHGNVLYIADDDSSTERG